MHDKIIQLTEALDQEAAHLENFIASARGNLDDVVLAEFFLTLREVYDKLDAARKRVYHAKERLNKQIIPEMLEAIGPEHKFSIHVPGYERKLYLRTNFSVSIYPDRKAEAQEWLRGPGDAEYLVVPQVNASALSKYASDRMDEKGEDLPDDLFKASTYSSTGIVKAGA